MHTLDIQLYLVRQRWCFRYHFEIQIPSLRRRLDVYRDIDFMDFYWVYWMISAEEKFIYFTRWAPTSPKWSYSYIWAHLTILLYYPYKSRVDHLFCGLQPLLAANVLSMTTKQHHKPRICWSKPGKSLLISLPTMVRDLIDTYPSGSPALVLKKRIT